MATSIHSSEIRNEIIDTMLHSVPILGWTEQALERAVIQAGFSQEDRFRAFEGDLNNALFHFIHRIDEHMNERLALCDLASMRVRDRIATIVMARLEVMRPYRPALPNILYYQILPFRISQTLRALAGTTSDMWYKAGDQATDFNYYSKRFLLAGVYTSTFLFWLRDNSADFEQTRDFLQARIDHVMKISLAKKRIQTAFQKLKIFRNCHCEKQSDEAIQKYRSLK